MAQVSVRNPLLGDDTPPERNTTSLRNKILVAATAIIVVVTLLYYGNSDTKASGGPWIGEVPRGSGNGGYVIETEVGAVAAEDGRCAEIGASALKNGGHAVDAAVATTICLGVVNPMSSGIGGGGFMVLRSAESGHAQAYDFRETAPLAASQNMYEKNPKDKAEGPLSMGVPGEVAGLHTAWLEHGRLPWWSLFQPSIQLARSGFVVAACLAEYMHYSKDQIMADPGLREVFAPKGKLLRKGDTCYNLKLARTLEVIAKQGASAFYNGTIGESLVRDVQEAGGILTIEDLRQYKVKVTDALAVDVMGHTILGMPPPSTGTVGLAMVLKILESYGTADAAKGPLGLHRLLESLKHMLAIRMNLGDPDFVNITHYVADMLSSSYATQIRHKILDNTTFPSGYYLPRWKQIKDHGTSHFCIVDANRNALSMTSTVNDHFGAGVISLSTGIVLNNEMDDFSMPTETNTDGLPPSVSNYIQPKKRPISAMTPVIILKDNQLAGVLGGSGGLYIPPGVIQVFLDHFVFGMEPLASVQHPRVYHKLTPNIVLYENWTVYDGDHFELPKVSVKFLEQRGHILQAQPRGSGCQLIVHNLPNTVRIQGKDGSGWLNNGVFHGTLTAVSDPRKDGRPAGI